MQDFLGHLEGITHILQVIGVLQQIEVDIGLRPRGGIL